MVYIFSYFALKHRLCIPAINVLSKNTKNVISFHLKINIFTAVKYCCILHGRVFVKILPVSKVIKRYLNQLKLSTSGRIFQQ